MKRVPLLVSIMLIGMLAATTALCVWFALYCRSARNASENLVIDPPFLDLEQAIRLERLDEDWTIHREPAIPGPYRVVGLMHVVGRKSGREGKMSLRNNGTIVATSTIKSVDDFDQLGLFVQSEHRQYDTVVLKRYKEVPD